ncbi:MAG: helix-turn-helix domain-containing protein [Dysgonamonadaceae bacterium]|jgi:transcriptional regulator with XRE-family HTH domain|nr:helix-turn-helix domain-containing protein [Dysgonamonadaceae bacterium]
MKERIIRIMKEKEMNAAQFSDAIGIQRATISHIIAGRNNPSLDMVKKILTKFPAINPDWLISGIEPMKRTSENPNEYSGDQDLFSQTVPVQADHSEQVNDIKTNPTPSPAAYTGNPADVRTETKFTNGKCQESDVYNSNNTKEIIKETIIYKERPSKTIDKILIFYSDNTYETFIPEKHEVVVRE